MKRYIKSSAVTDTDDNKDYVTCDRERYESGYSTWYGGDNPSEAIVEVLGKSIGNMDVFYVEVFPNGNRPTYQGYYVGEAPRNGSINNFGAWAWNIEEVFGIDASQYSSDMQIINAVNDAFMKYVDDPRSQETFEEVDVDPLAESWYIYNTCLQVGDPGVCRIYSTSIQEGQYDYFDKGGVF